jgi:25S rRNA (cytosine2870-C5)-methyltransferase
MKKQGPPEPLDEAHFTNLKRKVGVSVPESRSNSKKRRTSGGNLQAVIANETKESDSWKGSRGSHAKGKAAQNEKKKPATKSKSSKDPKPEAMPLPDSDEDPEEDSDATDLLNDEFEGIEDGGLGDGFLNSGSDVYDSDQDHPQPCFLKMRTSPMRRRSLPQLI